MFLRPRATLFQFLAQKGWGQVEDRMPHNIIFSSYCCSHYGHYWCLARLSFVSVFIRL